MRCARSVVPIVAVAGRIRLGSVRPRCIRLRRIGRVRFHRHEVRRTAEHGGWRTPRRASARAALGRHRQQAKHRTQKAGSDHQRILAHSKSSEAAARSHGSSTGSGMRGSPQARRVGTASGTRRQPRSMWPHFELLASRTYDSGRPVADVAGRQVGGTIAMEVHRERAEPASAAGVAAITTGWLDYKGQAAITSRG